MKQTPVISISVLLLVLLGVFNKFGLFQALDFETSSEKLWLIVSVSGDNLDD